MAWGRVGWGGIASGTSINTSITFCMHMHTPVFFYTRAQTHTHVGDRNTNTRHPAGTSSTPSDLLPSPSNPVTPCPTVSHFLSPPHTSAYMAALTCCSPTVSLPSQCPVVLCSLLLIVKASSDGRVVSAHWLSKYIQMLCIPSVHTGPCPIPHTASPCLALTPLQRLATHLVRHDTRDQSFLATMNTDSEPSLPRQITLIPPLAPPLPGQFMGLH